MNLDTFGHQSCILDFICVDVLNQALNRWSHQFIPIVTCYLSECSTYFNSSPSRGASSKFYLDEFWLSIYIKERERIPIESISVSFTLLSMQPFTTNTATNQCKIILYYACLFATITYNICCQTYFQFFTRLQHVIIVFNFTFTQ